MSLKEIRPFEDEHVGWTAATLESVSDMVFIADLKDRLIYANPAALKKFGYTKEELLGKTGEVMMSPNNPKELRAAILRATQESPYCWEGEVLNITKDGQEYTVHLNTALVRNKRGEPIGLTGISRDITERKKAQEQLEEYARKLEQANQELREMQGQLVKSEKLAAIGVLAAGLAHEIGNPLASISSLVQLLQRKIL
ncbi:MAG: MEKHLA domain-containing protein, partial [Deltaproteobacteria bacterium]|nr:MEKHLA domain-containing protein [Deltaproteobacteria bacterium]